MNREENEEANGLCVRVRDSSRVESVLPERLAESKAKSASKERVVRAPNAAAAQSAAAVATETRFRRDMQGCLYRAQKQTAAENGSKWQAAWTGGASVRPH